MSVGDHADAVCVHRVFALIFLLLGLRIVYWLAVKPILTRGGTSPLSNFVHQIVLIVLYVLTGLGFASHTLGWSVGGYLAGAGAVSIILGLALQETIGNLFSGPVLQASHPFKEGDVIEVSGNEGRVVGMTWRAVTICNGNGNYVIIPNATMAREKIINFYNPTRAMAHSLLVGLDYHVPPHEAQKMLRDVALETPGVLKSPEPAALLDDFGPVAMMYRVWFWVEDAAQRKTIEHAVRANTWYRLRQRGLEIPFANRAMEAPWTEKKLAARRDEDLRGVVKLLRKNPLFQELSDEQLRGLANESEEVLLPAGMTIYRQGEPGESLFVVKSGVMDVFMRATDGREHDVGDVLPGQSFGELSMMTDQPRSATLRARTDVACIKIRRDQMNEIFAKNPGVMATMSQVVARQQRMREEILKKLGATMQPETANMQSDTVLAKMRKLFGKFAS
jgi:small-conductance mechanosensitive channel/CRP-like cAMP-binding protein